MMYGSWDMKCDRQNFLLDCFLPFYPPNNPKKQNFEKMKKTPGDIIILHMFTINDNHMMHGSWDMKLDRQNFLSFWTVFCHFTRITNQKIKILKNHDHMLYCSLDMVCNRCNCYFSYWAIFWLFPSLTTWKIKIQKK